MIHSEFSRVPARNWIPLVAAAIGAGASIVGANDANRQSEYLARYGAEFSADEAKRQRDFQQYNADTAHQREVKDLEAAGLNPTLSAGGNGSATPAGASGSYSAPPVVQPNLLQAVGNFADVYQKQEKLKIETDLADEAIERSRAERGLTQARTENEKRDLPKNQMIHDFWKFVQDLGKKGTSVQQRMYEKPSRNQVPGYNAPSDVPTQPQR